MKLRMESADSTMARLMASLSASVSRAKICCSNILRSSSSIWLPREPRRPRRDLSLANSADSVSYSSSTSSGWEFSYRRPKPSDIQAAASFFRKTASAPASDLSRDKKTYMGPSPAFSSCSAVMSSR